MIFFSVINAFHNPANYSTDKLCVLIKTKTVINTRIRTRLVCSFAQYMLLNIMPKFALDLLWIYISVPDQWQTSTCDPTDLKILAPGSR